MPTQTNQSAPQAVRPSTDNLLPPPSFDATTSNAVLLSYLCQLERLAFRDYLTQLPNRCAIDFVIEQQFAAFHRYGTPFGVLLADLDDFKRVNDRYGHHAGDWVLRKVAESLRRCIREADFAGRWGGEEFMVIAPFTEKSALPVVAERIREHIATTQVRMNRSFVQMTASIGATVCRETDDSQSLLERVDNLLYESKTAGKDRITCG